MKWRVILKWFFSTLFVMLCTRFNCPVTDSDEQGNNSSRSADRAFGKTAAQARQGFSPQANYTVVSRGQRNGSPRPLISAL
jgi:hypothetical protein